MNQLGLGLVEAIGMLSLGLSPLYCTKEAPLLPDSLALNNTAEEQTPAMPANAISLSLLLFAKKGRMDVIDIKKSEIN